MAANAGFAITASTGNGASVGTAGRVRNANGARSVRARTTGAAANFESFPIAAPKGLRNFYRSTSVSSRERNRLSALVRDLRESGRAYPLMDIASGFLANPAFYLVKIETRAPEKGKDAPRLFQCKECKVLFFQKEALMVHALEKHLEKIFVREESKVEPPAGNFVVIARCKLSGALLGRSTTTAIP